MRFLYYSEFPTPFLLNKYGDDLPCDFLFCTNKAVTRRGGDTACAECAAAWDQQEKEGTN